MTMPHLSYELQARIMNICMESGVPTVKEIVERLVGVKASRSGGSIDLTCSMGRVPN
jgi:hypothetical protein